MISFDDFSKMEMKIGKILEVNDHPDANKLYVLKADIGEEQIQLVAGIKPYYAPDDLVGKSIVILTNLEPKVVRGVKSQGMLLAAQGKDEVILLTTDGEVEPGSSVR